MTGGTSPHQWFIVEETTGPHSQICALYVALHQTLARHANQLNWAWDLTRSKYKFKSHDFKKSWCTSDNKIKTGVNY